MRKPKFPFETWRLMPCEDPLDNEEVIAKVEAHIDTLRDKYGLRAELIGVDIKDGAAWARFLITSKV